MKNNAKKVRSATSVTAPTPQQQFINNNWQSSSNNSGM
jgi:hypothetical protein